MACGKFCCSLVPVGVAWLIFASLAEWKYGPKVIKPLLTLHSFNLTSFKERRVANKSEQAEKTFSSWDATFTLFNPNASIVDVTLKGLTSYIAYSDYPISCGVVKEEIIVGQAEPVRRFKMVRVSEACALIRILPDKILKKFHTEIDAKNLTIDVIMTAAVFYQHGRWWGWIATIKPFCKRVSVFMPSNPKQNFGGEQVCEFPKPTWYQ